MRFQSKLLFRYSLLVFFLVVVLAITFYAYTARLFENNAAGTYRLLTSRMSLHLDNLIHPMDFITENLISSDSFRTALITLATLDRSNPQNDLFLNEAAQTVRGDLLTYAIERNFYSVVVVTSEGDFFSSNFINHGQIKVEEQPLSQLPGYVSAESAHGRAIVVPPHRDPWDPTARVEVYGLARVVPGRSGDLAFIDVQNPVSDLKSLFSVPHPSYVRVLAIQRDGAPFYESRPTAPALVAYYLKAAQRPGAGDHFRRDPITGRSELIISATSTYTGITILLVLSRDVVLRPLAFVEWTTAGVSLLIILVSILYNWVSSARLTMPLRLIRRRIEETELSNLPGERALDHENDEIAALDRSFQRLRDRLDEAVKRELRSRTLWLQARLDSLQAQVNPHFLYNVLTVIAGKGLEHGDEEIGEICDAIAAMLRYSTSTASRTATIDDELTHVKAYLFLMKKRLEDRLEFAFSVDNAIRAVVVPKMLLQQIVENSVNYGSPDDRTPMRIRIRGSRVGERWLIEVCDNGPGFDAAALEELRARMARIGAQAALREEEPGMEIGGLGLLNTYIRLHLYYRGDFLWEMENLAAGGARIAIGGVFSSSDREVADVQDPSGRG